jgi:hypothetical protein
VWIGGGLVLSILAARAGRATDGMHLAELLREEDRLGTRVFMPASLTLLVSGVVLVLDGDWASTSSGSSSGWRDTWRAR